MDGVSEEERVIKYINTREVTRGYESSMPISQLR